MPSVFRPPRLRNGRPTAHSVAPTVHSQLHLDAQIVGARDGTLQPNTTLNPPFLSGLGRVQLPAGVAGERAERS